MVISEQQSNTNIGTTDANIRTTNGANDPLTAKSVIPTKSPISFALVKKFFVYPFLIYDIKLPL